MIGDFWRALRNRNDTLHLNAVVTAWALGLIAVLIVLAFTTT